MNTKDRTETWALSAALAILLAASCGGEETEGQTAGNEDQPRGGYAIVDREAQREEAPVPEEEAQEEAAVEPYDLGALHPVLEQALREEGAKAFALFLTERDAMAAVDEDLASLCVETPEALVGEANLDACGRVRRADGSELAPVGRLQVAYAEATGGLVAEAHMFFGQRLQEHLTGAACGAVVAIFVETDDGPLFLRPLCEAWAAWEAAPTNANDVDCRLAHLLNCGGSGGTVVSSDTSN